MKVTFGDILLHTDYLIRGYGFNGFSYGTIARNLNTSTANIHYYFPTKSALGTQLVKRETERIEASHRFWVDLSGEEQLKRFIYRFFNSSRDERACLTGALTPEYETFDGDMRDAVRKMCQATLELMTAVLTKARQEGSIYFQGEPADRALLVMSTLFSSLLLCRVLGEEVFDRMVDQMLKDLGSALRIAQFLQPEGPLPGRDYDYPEEEGAEDPNHLNP